MGKKLITTTESKFLAAVKKGKKRKIYTFKTKTQRDGFVKDLRKLGYEVLIAKI